MAGVGPGWGATTRWKGWGKRVEHWRVQMRLVRGTFSAEWNLVKMARQPSRSSVENMRGRGDQEVAARFCIAMRHAPAARVSRHELGTARPHTGPGRAQPCASRSVPATKSAYPPERWVVDEGMPLAGHERGGDEGVVVEEAEHVQP